MPRKLRSFSQLATVWQLGLVMALVLLLELQGSICWAQDSASGEVASDESKAQETRIRKAHFIAEGPSKAGVADPSGVTIEAGQDNNRGTISIAFSPSLTLKVSAPMDRSAGQAVLTDLDGLANDLQVGLAWQYAWGGALSMPPDALGVLARTQPLCVEYGLAESACSSHVNFEAALEEQHYSRYNVRRIGTDYLYNLFGGKQINAFGLEGSVGYRNYDYFSEEADLESVEKTSSSLTAAYARIGLTGRWLLSLTYQERYSDSSTSAQLCEPTGTAGLETCVERPLGPPPRKDVLIGRAEVRRFLWDGRLAVAPLVSYDFEDDVHAFELPVYFLSDPKSRFNGGVRLGWRSDEEELVASVFVGTPLQLF